jgi:hypothetical protein
MRLARIEYSGLSAAKQGDGFFPNPNVTKKIFPNMFSVLKNRFPGVRHLP